MFKRLAYAAITLFCVITVVFFLVRLAPGGPFDGMRRLPPEVESNLQAAYGLDKPLVEQYLTYLSNLAQGDLGPSFKQKDFSVNELVARGLPVSAILGTASLFIALAIGLAVGMLSGLSPGSRLDSLLMGISNLNIAIPAIVVAPTMLLVFSVFLSWFPAGGSDSWLHFVLPVIALALPYSAAIARLTRGGVAESRFEPHLMTAVSKGLPRRRIILRHLMPIAIIPVLSYLGPAMAGLLTGSVIVEQVFDLPGIGRYFVQGAMSRDYTLVMGIVIVYSAAILAFNLLVDLAYAAIDPRVRFS